MLNTNEWFYFTNGLDKTTCNKIKHAAKSNWKQSAVDTRKGITEEERITGRKSIDDIDTNSRISDVAWTSEQWIYDAIWKRQTNGLAGNMI